MDAKRLLYFKIIEAICDSITQEIEDGQEVREELSNALYIIRTDDESKPFHP